MEIERLQIEGGFRRLRCEVRRRPQCADWCARHWKDVGHRAYPVCACRPQPHARSRVRSAEHANAVLEDGSVTVEMADVLDTVTVTRAPGEDAPQASGEYDKPLVFSQTEIESLGLSEGGRLRLLDSFVSGSTKFASEEAAAVAAIRSAFKEITAAEADRANHASGLDGLAALNERIKSLEQQELQYRASSVDLASKQKQLAGINKSISASTVREGVLERFPGSHARVGRGTRQPCRRRFRCRGVGSARWR